MTELITVGASAIVQLGSVKAEWFDGAWTMTTEQGETSEFQAVEPKRHRIGKLMGYFLSEKTLAQRVQINLMALQDALLLWNRAMARPFFKSSPDVAQSKLTSCKVYSNRYVMLSAMDSAARSMEIGVLQGAFSRKIIDAVNPRLHTMIDIDVGMIDRTLFDGMDDRIDIREGASSDILPTLEKESFDFIYIDGVHDAAGVSLDLKNCLPLLKPNGTIMMNDYCNWSINQATEYGVMRVANEFLNRSDFEMIGIAIDGSGSFDVAIRRTAQVSTL